MADERAEVLLKQQAQLEGDRSVLDAHMREVAERVLPRQDTFNRSTTMEGEKRTDKIFDATALLALDRAASAIDSLITPTTQQYHKLDPEDDRLMEDKDVRDLLDEINKGLFRMRYRPKANFAAQAHETYVSLMAFGTQGMFCDEEIGHGTRYKSIPMSGLYISEGGNGFVDRVHNKFKLSARAAAQKFGLQTLPEKIRKAYETTPFQKFDFLHCVLPREELRPSQRDYHGMPFASYYISYEARACVGEGGYRKFPYSVSRHVTAPQEVYGRSPAMMVLPDIKMLNEMEKTIIRAGQKIVDPPLLLYGDGIISQFSLRPGALNYGGVNDQGNQLVHPVKMGSNLPIAFEMTEQKRKQINDAFFVTLFQILVQNPQMTATEALIRAQEKGQLLAPTVGRQQGEFLGTLIERELDIQAYAGVLEYRYGQHPGWRKLAMSGGGVKAVYTSPLTRLRRAEDGVAITRTIEQLAPLAQTNPEVLDIFDPTGTGLELAEINGVPSRVLRSMEQIMAVRDQRQKDMDAQKSVMAAESMAKTQQHVAKAQELTQSAQPA